MRCLIIIFIFGLMLSCGANFDNTTLVSANLLAIRNTIETRFSTPENFERTKVETNTFGAYLRNLPLKKEDALVHLFNGKEKANKVAAAVVDMEIGAKDLQQCADACMRLRGEYLFKQKKYAEISFTFTSGFVCKYSEWRKGKRLSINGNDVSWNKGTQSDTTYASFRKYMDQVFSYCGTLSLSRSLTKTQAKDVQIGDLMVYGGSPGHAVTVVDMCKNKAGETLILISQSYMPAQDIHILMNLNDTDISPWHKLTMDGFLETAEWNFDSECSWMRF